MVSAKTIEFVCVHCWGSFERASGDIAPGQETIACPECGEDVPVPPDDFEDSVPVDEPIVQEEGGSVQDVDSADAAEEQAAAGDSLEENEQGDDEAGDVEDAAPEGEEASETNESTGFAFSSDEGGVLGGVDEEKIMWKLEIPGGLTYNFHGLRALRRWSEGKRDLSGVRVQVEDEPYKSLGNFLSLIDQGLGVSEAFLQAGEEDFDTSGAKLSEQDQEDLSTFSSDGEDEQDDGGAPSLTDLEQSSLSDKSLESFGSVEGTDLRQPMPTDRVRSSVTGQFTFNVNQTKSSDGLMRFVFWFVGLLMGVGAGAALHKMEIWQKILP